MNDFVDFKREMVRLDYTAETLRIAQQRVTKEREDERDGLRRAIDDVDARSKSLSRQVLRDDQETQQLQKDARMQSERRRLLETDVLPSVRSRLQDMTRRRAKLIQAVNSLQQHRLFLSEIISRRVSPRTPSSTGRPDTCNTSSATNVELMMMTSQSPNKVKERLEQKERNVIGQAELVFQATDLIVIRFQSPPPPPPPPETRKAIGHGHLDKNAAPVVSAADAKLQFSLGDDVFQMIHALHSRFVSKKSRNFDPLGNLGAIECYAYYLLDLVDACEPIMLNKILAKIVVDKKKQLEAERLQKQTAQRAMRERVALQRATSAPAQFQRPLINRKQRLVFVRKQGLAFQEEVLVRHREDFSYLFRCQE